MASVTVIHSCAAIAVLALGCGSIVDAPGGQVDAGPGIDAAPVDPCAGDEIPNEVLVQCLTEAACEYSSRCVVPFASIEECVERDAREGGALGFEFFVRTQQPSLEDGSSVFDPAAARLCIDALRSEGACAKNGFIEEAEICLAMYVGQRVNGQSCFADVECGVGGDCQGGDTEDCMPGVCENAAPLFGDPSGGGGCQPGLHRVNNPVTMTETCLSGEEGSPCNIPIGTEGNGSCDEAFICVDEGGTLGVCRPTGGQGSGCTRDAECGPGLQCLGDDPAPGAGTCQPASSAGDQCDRVCDSLLYCDFSGGSPGVCAALPGNGQSCDENATVGWPCNSIDLVCEMGICQPGAQVGESCATRSCALGFECLDDICVGFVRPGESCENEFCLGNCVNNTCEEFPSCYPES